jgi:hypothetical protein
MLKRGRGVRDGEARSPLPDSQIKRETCPHDDAQIVKPGSVWRASDGVWHTKWKCPDCGAWWVAERQRDD